MKNENKKKKDEKSRKNIKRIIAGILSLSMIISLIPNIKYYIKKNSIKNSISISSELNSDDNARINQICYLFEKSIYKNNNLSDEEKQLIIKGFEENFLKKYAKYLDDNAIVEMCASAQTIDVKLMSEFTKKWAWWSGSYNPYTNRYSIYGYQENLASHENLHAILKRGFASSGLNTLIYGYGINEGATALYNDDDDCYFEEKVIANHLSFIIGYEKMIDLYLNGNTIDFINEISKYTSKTKVMKLVTLLDLKVFSDYKEIFVNNFKDNLNDLEDYNKNYYEALEIIKEMYENKYSVKLTDSNLGKFIINSDGFNSENNLNFYYTLWFNDNDKITINTGDFNQIIKEEDGKTCLCYNSCSYTYDLEEIKNVNFEDWCEMVRYDLDENLKSTKK